MDKRPTSFCKGKVYLVGAGPGDADLLTIKAQRLLESADLVLHDDLVTPEILSMAGPQTQVFNVGKRCGAKAITQAEINARMVAGARAALRVVRLKGGDPSIFGRLAEELNALMDASVPFEVVPGVTAASAAAAMLGVSLTDRRTSSKVVIVSGHHAHSDEQHKPDWRMVASPDATHVIYMPGRDLSRLRCELLSAGASLDLPAVIISHATTLDQKHVCTTLGHIDQAPELESPAILLLGWHLAQAGQHVQKNGGSSVIRQAELLLSSL